MMYRKVKHAKLYPWWDAIEFTLIPIGRHLLSKEKSGNIKIKNLIHVLTVQYIATCH